jgi:hypothetical protein
MLRRIKHTDDVRGRAEFITGNSAVVIRNCVEHLYGLLWLLRALLAIAVEGDYTQ